VPQRRKILVFAHVPPPHHGQSAMVKLMLDGMRAGRFGEFDIHHIDARFSDTMEEIGGRGPGKVWRAMRFALQAIRLRISEGIQVFYYIPAPPKWSAMVRDWLILAMCRPFFPKVVLHWHAVGLGEWTARAQKSGDLKFRIAAWLNLKLLGGHYRSLVLTDWGREDVKIFQPGEIFVVPNGIPDPCGNFEERLLGERQRRVAEFRESLKAGPPTHFKLCFLGHCTGEKGLWDAMEAVAIGIGQLRVRSPSVKLSLWVAGEFPSAGDRARFEEVQSKLADLHCLSEDWVCYVGFIGGEKKRRFLEEADGLVFPTRYAAESFGLVAVEALAMGMPAVTSDWRMLPELMAKCGLPVYSAGDPAALAEGILAAIGRDDPAKLRAAFSGQFTEEQHLEVLLNSLG
jgi:glycosyltransferase involved in cell wall biosynthesis